jgi:hypothetical protein
MKEKLNKKTIAHNASPDTTVSSTNKTDRHDITEILLKVALITITLTHIFSMW